MKEKLTSALGTLGFWLYFAVALILVFMPTIMLGFPFWLRSILLVVYLIMPTFFSYAMIPIYIWAIIDTLNKPIDAVSIAFFVVAAIYFFIIVLPTILSLFSGK